MSNQNLPEPGQNVQQRTLAGSRGPQNCRQLSAPKSSKDVLQNVLVVRFLLDVIGEVFKFDSYADAMFVHHVFQLHMAGVNDLWRHGGMLSSRKVICSCNYYCIFGQWIRQSGGRWMDQIVIPCTYMVQIRCPMAITSATGSSCLVGLLFKEQSLWMCRPLTASVFLGI